MNDEFFESALGTHRLVVLDGEPELGDDGADKEREDECSNKPWNKARFT